MNKNKGFTLVELIAVIIILAMLILFAVTAIIPSSERARKKSFINEAKVFADGALNKYSDDRLKENYGEDLYLQEKEGKVCYSIQDSLIGPYVSKDDVNYKGSVEVCFGDDCEYRTKVWLTDGIYHLDGAEKIDAESFDLITESSSADYLNCGQNDGSGEGGSGGTGSGGSGGSSTPNKIVVDFAYTGDIQEYTVIKTGVYSMEVWGGSGGGVNESYPGGTGGYAYGEFELEKGDVLYIVVGGEGAGYRTELNKTNPGGGYNGGAGNTYYGVGGGGATHIADQTGVLETPVQPSHLYIVAGGGGAGYYRNSSYKSRGYGGGGYMGAVNHTDPDGTILSGKQSCSVEYYGTSVDHSNSGNYGAGGGGFCGGTKQHEFGGSGYIANFRVHNGVMYCNGCIESSAAATKTISTENYSLDPVSQYAKIGDGHARIKYLKESF